MLLIWCGMLVLLAVVGFYLFNDEMDAPVPDSISERGSIQEFYMARKGKDWGNAERDGPDKCMPDRCYWKNGILICKV